MPKKKPEDLAVDTSAASTDSDAASAAHDVLGTSQHALESETYVMVTADGPYGAEAVVADTAPGPKSYYLIVGGVRHSHVGDMKDGRWIYRPDV